MLNPSIDLSQMWTTVQEPRTPSYVPNSYLLLLSALDAGWQVSAVDLASSWDQHGFIYVVSLHFGERPVHQQIILPKNPLVDSLLDEYFSDHSAPSGD
jgi:hypothetical protein